MRTMHQIKKEQLKAHQWSYFYGGCAVGLTVGYLIFLLIIKTKFYDIIFFN